MTTLRVHTIDSAPEESKPYLEAAQKAYGRIPNLLAVFAESPALLRSYMDIGEALESASAFDATELQIVLMATSFDNDCGYCMAAHSAIAGLQKVPAEVVRSLRDGTPIVDEKLEALRTFTRAVVRKRGWVGEQDVQAFFDAGYTPRHLLEVVLGIGFKTLSNFTNHLAKTPVDRQFQRFAWTRPETVSSDSSPTTTWLTGSASRARTPPISGYEHSKSS